MDGLEDLIAMLPLQLGTGRGRLNVLCLGAHSDDIEIGCAGTLLRWIREHRRVSVTWVVMTATAARAKEAKQSARALARGAAQLDVIVADFPDAFLPAVYAKAKGFVSDLGARVRPDVILTHRLEDRHQDHRLLAELTWQTWRDHLILEYEIPKYEGDLGQPNFYMPLSTAQAKRKVDHLMRHFGTQRAKDWFNRRTFLSLMHGRGVECRAKSGFAEAFFMRKAVG